MADETTEEKEEMVAVVQYDEDRGLVTVEFTHPLKWFALDPKEALELAAVLTEHAGRHIHMKDRDAQMIDELTLRLILESISRARRRE